MKKHWPFAVIAALILWNGLTWFHYRDVRWSVQVSNERLENARSELWERSRELEAAEREMHRFQTIVEDDSFLLDRTIETLHKIGLAAVQP